MGKKNKKKRSRDSLSSDATAPQCPVSAKTKNGDDSNPLLEKQMKFLNNLSELEREEFFSPTLSSDRRAELWMTQAELGEVLVNRYAWATPNDTAIRILKEFSPLVEIGCGSNAYWCRIARQAGVDIIGYDVNIRTGGTIETNPTQHSKKKKRKSMDDSKKDKPSFLRQGGPEVLSSKGIQESRRSLFLCYPDEEDEEMNASIDDNGEEVPISMGWQCLDRYKGDYVIHVGELFIDTNLSMEQAPWGRSSSGEFQQRLASEFHCLLKVELPNWLHTRDSISVWKRSIISTIVFAADEEDDDEEDEEVEYRHVPKEERLPKNIAAPCLTHLLPSSSATIIGRKNQKNDDDQEGYHVSNDAAPSSDASRASSNRKKKRAKKNHQEEENGPATPTNDERKSDGWSDFDPTSPTQKTMHVTPW